MVLILNVVSNCKFIDSNGRYKVTPCPEITLWEFLGFLLEPIGRFGFENHDCVSYGVLGWDYDVEMDMFISYVPLDNLKTFPVGNKLEYSLELLFNVVISQHLPTVAWGPYYMVLTYVG